MKLDRRIVGVSLGALLGLTAAGAPPVIEPLAPDAKSGAAFVSPLAEAKTSPLPAILAVPASDPFQPAEWRLDAKVGDSADRADAMPAPQPAKAVAATASIDAREMECLARAVYYEARGEPLAGQAAVAHVILNRKRSGRFPTTVCGVVDQPGQFTFRAGRAEQRHPGQWARAQRVAAQVVAGELANPVGSALFFHADHVSPGWKRPRVAEIGNHIFYR